MPDTSSVPASAWSTNRVVGAVGVVCGTLVVAHGVQISVGTLTEPKPGLWPAVTGVLLVVASLGVMTRRLERTDEEVLTRDSLAVAPALASLFVFIWAFSLWGFVLPGFLLGLFWLKVLGRCSWLLSVVVAAVAAIAIHYLFVSVLAVPFPEDLVMVGR